METSGIDVLVARSGVNFTYLAQFEYTGTLARHLDLADSPRGVVVIWPREGDPALVVNSIAAPRAHRYSAIETIHIIDSYGNSYATRVGEILTEMGYARARIGAEDDVLSARAWNDLTQALPDADIVSCTDLMHAVRAIKTPAEVEAIRKSARRLDEIYVDVFRTITPGESERTVHARLVGSCLTAGATSAHGILNSSRNGASYCGESDFLFAAGDIVRNDYVAWFDGYPGHQSRPAVLGSPSSEQVDRYEAVRAVYLSTIAFARPGRTGDDVYRHAVREFQNSGINGTVPLAGHGVGPWWHQQPPFLVEGSKALLETGMVIAFEPHVDEYHLQDLYLIGEHTNECLSPDFDTRELWVAGA